MQIDLTDVSGNEKLNVSERIVLFFKELSLSIDKLNSDYLNGSIHTVKDSGLYLYLSKQGVYFELSSNQIPTPVFFNPETMSYREYVDFVLSGIGLLKQTYTEACNVYDALKQAAVKETVPYKLRDFSFQKILEELDQKIEKLSDGKKGDQPLSSVFKNFVEANDTLVHFNKSVSTLTSREPEVLNKKIDQVIDLMKIVKRKMEVSEIALKPDDVTSLEIGINRLNKAVQMSGRLIGMLNELTRVSELQIQVIKEFKK